MMITQRRYKQGAFTLVELVATISTASVLLALATGVVHRMMRFESASRQRASVHRTALRLSHDFRHDIHRAEGIELSDHEGQTPMVRLILSEVGDVTYQVANQRVLREQRLDDEQVARETYDFPTDYQVSFSQPAPRTAKLTVVHHLPLVGINPQTVLHVEAELGRLLRLTQVEGTTP
jgi:type II secretory pathway pseudopilin PulG